MADTAEVLEELRRSLAHLEARQHATGSTAEPDFWARVAAPAVAAEDGPAQESHRSPSPVSRRGHGPGRARSRRLAPHARGASRPSGPWAGLPAGVLESVDPADVRWTSESDAEDPGWIAAMASLADVACEAVPGGAPGGSEGPGMACDERDDRRCESREEDNGQGGLDEDAWSAARGGKPGDAEPVAVLAEAMVGMSLHRHAEDELRRAAEAVAAQRAAHDVMLVGVLAELESRGVEPPGGLSRVDWLRSLDPTVTAGSARAFVRVAAALTQPRWGRLRTLVATQQVTVAKAAQIIEFEQRSAPVADAADLAIAVADVTEQARTLRPEELATVVRQHAEQIRPPEDDDALEEGRRQARGLWFGQPNTAGMVTMRGTLDPEAAAVLKSAVDPLSVPCPTTDEHGRLLERDGRSPAKRRADALVEIVARGVSAPDGVATTDKAKVVVLIDHDTLLGQVRGTGRTLSGDVLTATDVRRVACDAAIIPVVLGGRSEPLDVGRERRLVTKGLRLALTARDRGCSFPGCTVPAQWTDAHHVTHWVRGGATSLLTTALLCRRHHTHVHRHDLDATVTEAGVTWHV